MADEKTDTQKQPKPRRFSLPFFKKGKKTEAPASPENQVDKNSGGSDAVTAALNAEPLTPQEVVNSLDSDIEVLATTKEAALDEEMTQQIQTVNKNVVSIKIKKSKIIWTLGGLLLGLWAIPGFSFAKQIHQSLDYQALVEKFSPANVVDAVEEIDGEIDTTSEASDSGEIKVRVKDSSGDEKAVASLVESLKELDYDLVEVVKDDETRNNIMVVARAGNEDLASELTLHLESDYELASPSAVLSSDSDFNLVVLFGQTNNQ